METQGPQGTPPSPRKPHYYVCLGSTGSSKVVLEHIVSHIPTGRGVAFFLQIPKTPLPFHTTMSITAAKDGMLIEADTIYLLPSDMEASLSGDVLSLSAERSGSLDAFLRSLAVEHRERAIVVMLADVRRSCSQGIKRIKEEGGLVIVQDPDSEECHPPVGECLDMKLADLVARPLDIPQHILHWITHLGRLVPESEPVVLSSTSVELQKIVSLLRAHSGHDFSLYKKNTLRRRIERRMIAQKIDTLSNYIRLLEAEAGERESLLKEILIGVTNFFRDTEAFQALKTVYLPQILQNVMQDKTLRIWVAGCSTGEEAYSIAMSVLEACENQNRDIDLRIFASDIDKDAIDIAREGRYPKTIAAEVSAERLKNFFYEGVHEYKIKPEIKERIIFAVHNAVRDPPFSKVDLISCRNLMIYLEPVLQQKLLRIFHYGLNPGGFLFLGSSETTGDANNLFTPLDKKWKFFERKSGGPFPSRTLDIEASQSVRQTPTERIRADLPGLRRPSIRELSQSFLMSSYVPPSLICDSAGDILFVHGRMSEFLETAQGEAHMNVFTMARDEIKLEVSRGFQKVLSSREAVRFKDIKVKRHNDLLSIDIVVRPVSELSYQQRLIIISFEATHAEPLTPENVIHLDQRYLDERTQNIERELLFTREHMQTLVEQLETSNEELKSMNEELQSSNEELQSSNEELETAKEELQAVNEELVTLNTELQIKIEELSSAHNDLDNFLSSSSIATIFLNRYLLITRYSRSATKIFNLIPSDIGRSLGDFATQMKYDRVLQDAEEVLNILAPIERIVEMKDNRTLFMRITPYKTAANVIDGVVIGFSDITEQNRLEKSAAMYQSICEKIPNGLLVFDQNEKVIFANEEFCNCLGLRSAELPSTTLNDLGIHGIPQHDKRSWTGKIRLQGELEHAMTAEATVTEVNFLLAMPHYLLIIYKLESNP
ncbi:CheR family methyltransferase [Oligoflexus tunisiensis]|uniref:CheR family methyltransferase n=1 Tax=Oligoflexus tunisiensis TaxID=708132 RepID=UPI000B27FFBD|nr:CheR family methyltransferase [Oligoflexus tunisiensis]